MLNLFEKMRKMKKTEKRAKLKAAGCNFIAFIGWYSNIGIDQLACRIWVPLRPLNICSLSGQTEVTLVTTYEN